ncbi:acyl-CoA dehydrogenase [Mycobacterium ahvazicum]|uniref:Acyl-CoA dehydrogenase n=1 Tax=Mycobacterium ahvazicum TaxID=1964395 RepID=A0A2K4YAP1_9MYCO|nr:acyl-CoA dehydrogenase family protein [Mycobacterium ahvazicum]SOX53865.1 acyl-CoA dehydrogenase [Mycobacterium ahvazicum]
MTTAPVEAIRVDPALIDMMDAVLGAYRTTHAPTGTVDRDAQLWRQLDELGLVRLTGPEHCGGSDAGWYEAAELLTATVRHGARIPLAEHDLLACWLLEASGSRCDSAVRTVCLLDDHGAARDVPWASGADRIAVIWQRGGQHHVADVGVESLQITPGVNMIGEPRDVVIADSGALRGVPLEAAVVEQLRLKSALVRAVQVCAALDEILQLCIEHASSRIQFGRPLSRFQAVQNMIADIAAQASLARSATDAALTVAVTSSWSGPNLGFLVAVARSCVGHAASVVVRHAHQVHGAIGTTREHRLHEFTRPALVWRGEFGSVQHWDARVTDAALQAGGTGLWNLITG